MARIAVNNLSHYALALCLLFFPRLDCQGKPLPSDKHILCFNFTVEASSEHGKSWLNIYCSLDEKLLFEYNNANKANLVGSSGEGQCSTDYAAKSPVFVEVTGVITPQVQWVILHTAPQLLL
ncbi:hypothetical protein U0070_002951 [Myodes glareolus]|uniref:Uncharacterized protein n=1 Tax=Myodes glareolus TaxID=447135 RepID=A0AAW0HPI6_MYOGA